MIVGSAATHQIAALLVDELNKAPTEIETLLVQGSRKEAARRAHSLAGAAASLGYSKVADASRRLEADLRETPVKFIDLSELFEAAQNARESLERVIAALKS